MCRECQERFPRHRRLAIPTCVTHVPWCMPGSLTSGFLWSRWQGKRSRHSRHMHNPLFCASGKRPIPEMAVDDCYCPHCLIYFGALSVDFIVRSLSFTMLIELNRGFLSGDNTFAHPFNEVVSLGIIIVCSWWKAGCPQGADQFGIDLCRGHNCFYFVSSGSVKFMQGTMSCIVEAGMSFQRVMHG